MIKQASQVGWWEKYRNAFPASILDYWTQEASSKRIYAFCPVFMPGLLQTEAYTRALLTPFTPMLNGTTLQERVEARVKRQWHIFERPEPVEYHAVFDEFVLARQVGGKEVLYEQLQHLHKLSQSPHITLHIVRWHAKSDYKFLYFAGVTTLLDNQVWHEDLSLGLIKDENPIVVSNYQGYFRNIIRGALSPAAGQRYLEDCIATFE